MESKARDLFRGENVVGVEDVFSIKMWKRSHRGGPTKKPGMNGVK